MKRKHSSKEIRDFIIQNVEEHPGSISRMATAKFGVSRQSVNRHLQQLVREELLTEEGSTRNKRYELKPLIEEDFVIPITPGLEEDKVWREHLTPLLKGTKPNVVGICQYGFTEMFNNVLEHSEAKLASGEFKRLPNRIELVVEDNGIGIFNKIVRDLGLEDQRQAILELSKGKLTTDPESHSGEGIFFTTRMFDEFSILSGELYFSHNKWGDWLLEDMETGSEGTRITMTISPDSDRTIKEVFDRYAAEVDDYGFTRTHVPAALARYGGENLISRSQAKRLLARFENFKEVLLDFGGIDSIGQAFADEIFRVFQNNHPDIKIIALGANGDVERMIKRATNQGEL